MINKAKLSYQFVVILIIFIVSYFFYAFIGLNKVVSLTLVGILVACCYFLLHIRISLVFKICIISLVCLVALFIPYFIFKKNIVEKFEGIWQTDTMDGFSINMSIHKDTAYLSQSNIKEVVPFKMEITDHKFSIVNNDRRKKLHWEYCFLKNGAILILYNVNDSLRLYKSN